MPNIKYDWEQIIRDMTVIIPSDRIAAGKKPPTTSATLYHKLSKKYSEQGQPFPTSPEIFIRKVHSAAWD